MLNRIINSFQFGHPHLAAIVFKELPLRAVPELNSAASLDWDHQIPNDVYLTWEENAFGKTHAFELQRFRQINRDCNFHFFDARQQAQYMEKYYGDHPIFSVYTSARAGAMRADIWRYCILYERGGVLF